jgi:SAM-dependent methyltransferase
VLRVPFVDLGLSPLANRFIDPERALEPEPFYPLCVLVCESCLLVQLPELESAEAIFSDYAYFSSFADTWLEHARAYVAAMVERFALGPGHQVVEVASNDGYLLRYFKERQIPVLGVEPAKNVAEAAITAGIPTRVEFFGQESARRLVDEGLGADLLLGNNVLAHVPDLNDFVAGMAIALKPGGILTMEFPHLLRLIAGNQFDTIYHEHFSYFSLDVARRVFARHGLALFDVEELSTHGGSLRIYAAHAEDGRTVEARLPDLLEREAAAGLHALEGHLAFGRRVRDTRRRLLEFLWKAKDEGGSVVGYGAPAKGNTLLNYCGVGRDLVDYTVDRSPHKQGRLLPGTRLPIHPPQHIFETRPDYVLILPWNLRDEVAGQMAGIAEWGGKFVVAIPELEVF